MALSSIFKPLPAYNLTRSLAYGPDGGTQPPATPPTSPTAPSGSLTPINNPIDTAEGISFMPGQEGKPYTGAGAQASAPSQTTAAPSGSQGGGGSGFNLNFEDDPILAKIRAFNQQQIANAETNALAARKQAEIGFGYDPNIKYEDAATQAAAQQNAYSTLAQLLFNHQQRGLGLDESLNKSNLFYSGERAKQLGLEGRQYGLEQSTANTSFQNALSQIAQQVLQAKADAQARELQGEEDAYNRALQFAMTYGGDYGGGGGGGQLQYTSGAQQALANAGYDPGTVSNAIYQTMAARGWGYYNNGTEAPSVQQNGQVFNDGGGNYIQVKVGTPQGNSTEKVYLP